MFFFKTIPSEQTLKVGDRVEYGLMPYDGIEDIYSDASFANVDCMVIAVIDPVEKTYKIVDCNNGNERFVHDCDIEKTKRANINESINIEFLIKK